MASMLAASPRLLFRPCIARPVYRAKIVPSIPCRRLLSTAQINDWRLLSWRGRADTSTEATARHLSARRIPRSQQSSSGPEVTEEEVEDFKSKGVVFAILGVNTLVFGAWYMAKNSYKYDHNGRPLQFMFQNFTSSLTNLQNGRLWTLLTSCFSHQEIWHFGINSVGIYLMAPAVCQILRPKRFLAFYMGAGIISSLVSIGWNAIGRKRQVHSLGASGATYGIMTFFACLFPRAQFAIFGVIPAPAWVCVSGVFTWDLWQAMVTNPRGNTDSAGHIGGILAGIGYYIIMRRGYRRLFRR